MKLVDLVFRDNFQYLFQPVKRIDSILFTSAQKRIIDSRSFSSLVPKYFIDFGKKSITRKDVLRQNLPKNSFGYYDIKIPDDKMCDVSGVAYNDRYFRFAFRQGKDTYLNIINRQDTTSLSVKTSNIKDDIFSGSMYRTPYMAEDLFIDMINPSTLNEKSKKELGSYINTDGLSDNSNPILIFYSYNL